MKRASVALLMVLGFAAVAEAQDYPSIRNFAVVRAACPQPGLPHQEHWTFDWENKIADEAGATVKILYKLEGINETWQILQIHSYASTLTPGGGAMWRFEDEAAGVTGFHTVRVKFRVRVQNDTNGRYRWTETNYVASPYGGS